MDKRINLLNKLKKRLSGLVYKQNTLNKDDNTISTEYLRLKSMMLKEHILSGLVFDESMFNKNEVYAEITKEGKLNYHIYPLMNNLEKPVKQEIGISEESIEKNNKVLAEIT